MNLNFFSLPLPPPFLAEAREYQKINVLDIELPFLCGHSNSLFSLSLSPPLPPPPQPLPLTQTTPSSSLSRLPVVTPIVATPFVPGTCYLSKGGSPPPPPATTSRARTSMRESQ